MNTQAPDADRAEVESEEFRSQGGCEVSGQIRGEVLAGSSVRVVLRTLSGVQQGPAATEQSAGEVPVSSEGEYSLRFSPPRSDAPMALGVQLLSPSGIVAAESVVMLGDSNVHRVVLWAPAAWSERSEYEQVAELTEGLDGFPDALTQLTPEGVGELADWLDVEQERLTLLQQSRRLEQAYGLPGSFFYALGENGQPSELHELIDIPKEELRTTLEQAVARQVIPVPAVASFEEELEKLENRIVESALVAERSSPTSGLSDILLSASLPQDTVREVLKCYQSRTGSAAEFWRELSAEGETRHGLGPEVARELAVTAEVGGLLDFDIPLLRRVQELRTEGRWKSPPDLAALDFDDWCDLIEEVDAIRPAPSLVEGEPELEEEEEVLDALQDALDNGEDLDSQQELGIESRVKAELMLSDDDAAAASGDGAPEFEEAELAEDEFEEDEFEEDEFEEDELEEAELEEAELAEDELAEDELAEDELAEDEFEEDEFEEAELEEDEDHVQARASAIMESLEEAFPSVFIRRELIATGEMSPAAQKLLQRVPSHDFTASSLRETLETTPSDGEGLEPEENEAALEEIEAIERISRITQRPEQVVTLLGSGLGSAHAIAATPRRHFTTIYGEALGGRAEASQVHAQAQQTAAASTLALVRLLQALQQTPQALGGPALATPAAKLKGVPDAQALFGSIGLCECKHCGSVYSPAAYFVDLLRYLDIKNPQRLKALQAKLRKRGYPTAKVRRLASYKPLDVLLARRPDLAELPLTCANTLTTLPYIDLVNELLEARVLKTSAAHDTGTVPSAVLKAVPQHVNAKAYAELKQAVHPVTLPYDEPLSVCRAYLGHLGVKRLDLMRAFARGDSREDGLVAEALGMSPGEFGLITNPPKTPWLQLGFSSEQDKGYPDALSRAPAFLDATGITFTRLIDLLRTRFLNPEQTIKLESPSPDCDPGKVRILGLNTESVLRLLQLTRLQRRLGWKISDLDRALWALGAKELTPEVLAKLRSVRELAERLSRPVSELLAFWSPLDTYGENHRFGELFATRAVAWSSQDAEAFSLQSHRKELSHTADNLDPVAPALLAAFRITSDELSLIRGIYKRRGNPVRLDLAGLSAVYRVSTLARSLALRVEQLEGFLRLVPKSADPFRAGDPASTERFVDLVRDVKASGFSIETLVYMFQPVAKLRRSPEPSERQVHDVLNSIRGGLSAALSASAPPAVATADSLKEKLGMLLDGTLLDAAMEVLDPGSKLPMVARQEFFQRHLALFFKSPAVLFAQLFEQGPGQGSTQVDIPLQQSEESPAAFAEPSAARVQESSGAATTGGARGQPAQDRQATASSARRQIKFGLVMEHLLPYLRARKMRGAVVQTLSDALATTHASTLHLITETLQSRRQAGEPLLVDFLSLLGTGLTGRYFSNPSLEGSPVHTQVDPQLEFSWAGGAPAPGVPEKAFSISWRGNLLPTSKSAHTFFVTTDGSVRILLKRGKKEEVLLNHTGTGATAEPVSQAVNLEASRLYEIQIDYRSSSKSPHLKLQYGTSPGSKVTIPTASLYPVGGLSSFEPIAQSYRKLHKASLLVTGFSMTDEQLSWLTAKGRYIALDALPMEETEQANPATNFQRWHQLAQLYSLRKRLPHTETDLFSALRQQPMPAALSVLAKATGWTGEVLSELVGPQALNLGVEGLALPLDPASVPPLVAVERAMNLQRRLGVAPAVLNAWANTEPGSDMASSIVQTVKARYDEKRWLEVAQACNDPLRIERRDALVEFLLPRMRDVGVRQRSELFEFFLIDVEMNPCMLTSRTKQSISAVQTFFQRCLMNLEPQVNPRLIDNQDWKWLKNYRVWEANRKVFLYPENWIEPELRDDKSPIFQQLERAILQQEIKKENVESAFLGYLERLDEVSRLDVRAVWFDKAGAGHSHNRRSASSKWYQGTYHIFARTFNAPHVWFYRRLEKGRTWTPWEKIEADIEGDHLVPIMYQGRLHLFWTVFREQSKTVPMKKNAAPFILGKDWEISLAYSVYERGRWTRKQLSEGVLDSLMLPIFLMKPKKDEGPRIEGSAWLSPSTYTLRATVKGARLIVFVYRRGFNRLQSRAPRVPKSPGRLLAASNVETAALFELDGCNGKLVPIKAKGRRQFPISVGSKKSRRVNKTGTIASVARLFGVRGGRRRIPAAKQSAPRTVQPFSLRNGGKVPAPSGYQVDATGLSATRLRQPLIMPSNSGGSGRVLTRTPAEAGRSRLVPVVDTSDKASRGWSPFFYQDRLRSYFVLPVDEWIGERRIRVVARPLTGAQGAKGAPKFGRKKPKRRSRRRRRRSRREMEEQQAERRLLFGDVGALESENLDAEEDSLDECWSAEEDSPERRRRRRRRRRPRARARVRSRTKKRTASKKQRKTAPPRRPIYRTVVQAAHEEQRLKFTPFEQPATGGLIYVLKTKGIDGLLRLRSTRANLARRSRDGIPAGVWRPGIDHRIVKGRWLPRRDSWFGRSYKPGPMVAKEHPRLDVDFHSQNPYASYNWELFFHAPLQVAIRLASDGRHEESQRWFHFIFDPTTDVSSPAPQRYWRFAPFNENSEYAGARELMALLSYAGDSQSLIRRQLAVKRQVTDWWEKPFSPHVIARLRTAAYQKAVVMKYIDNLIEWGDKLFRKDTMESIQEATQLYILAGNILGKRPERVPTMVEPPPVTFGAVREKLDPFANWVVRFENSQVRRPFRIAAAPDTGGAAAILGMATQYFCIPPNPDMDKRWETVAERLFKIRNCMNIQGTVRQLALFEPPIDPAMLVRAAAAGVDLGSVLSSLNAPPPHHRFRVLIQRARRLATEVQRFGRTTLEVLKQKDAEALAALRASNETSLQNAVRDIRKLKVKQVEEELARYAAMRDGLAAGIQYYEALLAQPVSPQAAAGQQSLNQAQAIGLVAEGVDLVSKVLYAIPDFQAGGSGAFGSPYATVQMGGQMLGDISSAFATSLGNVMSTLQTEANMSQAMADLERQKAEWTHFKGQLEQEKLKVEKQINETSLKLEISNSELRRHDTAVENSKNIEARLREMFTSEQLYGWMLGQLSGLYFEAYKLAFDGAKLAERAHQFELGDSGTQLIRFSYWDSLKKGLLAGDRLLVDLEKLESAHLEGETRALEITRHLSLKEEFPTQLEQLLASGQTQLEVTESLLDGDFPGHYFRRIKTVSISVLAPLKPLTNVNCTLTLLKNTLRKSANASGSYAKSQDAEEDPRFLTDLTPVQVIATSQANADPGLFKLNFEDERYLPFEGAGAISSWRLNLRQADNALNLAQVQDVFLSVSYTARDGGSPLEAAARASRAKRLAAGKAPAAPQYRLSLRWDLPAAWKQLADAKEGQEIELELPLGIDHLSGRYKGSAVRLGTVDVYGRTSTAVQKDALKLRLTPPKKSRSAAAAWEPAWPGNSTLKSHVEVSGPAGIWKATVSAKGGTVPTLFDDVVLVFQLQVRNR